MNSQWDHQPPPEIVHGCLNSMARACGWANRHEMRQSVLKMRAKNMAVSVEYVLMKDRERGRAFLDKVGSPKY